MPRDIVEFEPTDFQRAIALAATEAWNARKPSVKVVRFLLPVAVDASVWKGAEKPPSPAGVPYGEAISSGIFVPALGDFAGVRIYAGEEYFIYCDGRFILP